MKDELRGGNPRLRRRRPDLAAQQKCCDLNYLRLRRLLNNFRDGRQRVLYAPGSEPGRETQMRVRFVDRRRHTDTLRIDLRIDGGAYGEMSLIVRVYKDLRCAETVRCNGRHLRARYPYPNAQMFSPNEKEQLNRFLGEWLERCLQDSYAAEIILREA